MHHGAPRIAIFGGSGMYELLDDVEHVDLTTPYGAPSAPIAIGTVERYGSAVSVAFLPRHGRHHELPAHRVNYRANAWAMRSLGVERILAPFAAGSLQVDIEPGHVVVCDQLVDRTTRRDSTFFDGPVAFHASFADPYCPTLRNLAISAARRAGFTTHETGTVVVIEGPRFSTRAESQSYRAAGWQLVNMTQQPEASLARELGMCFCGIAYATDYDAGVEGRATSPVTEAAVFEAFAAALPRLRELVLDAALAAPTERACACASGAGPVDQLAGGVA